MLLGLALLSLLIVPATLLAPPPQWWTTRGVINSNPADDYAAANLGQLKHFATKAAAELAQFPGRPAAIPAVNAMLAAWAAPAPAGVMRDDYAALNLGQLKAVAKPFYDRLIAIGYTDAYPWSLGTSDDDDYAVANLGQLKQVFSFDRLSVDARHDVDENGIPDWWEKYYFGATGVAAGVDTDGNGLPDWQEYVASGPAPDAYAGSAPVLTIESGNEQQAPPIRFVRDPLRVKVINANGAPLANVPVTFVCSEGGAKVALTRNKTGFRSTHLRVLTGADGVASAFVRVPNEEQAIATIQVLAPGYSASAVTLSASTNHALPPAAPSNVQSYQGADGRIRFTWQDNSADESGFGIDRQKDDGEWEEIAQVGANVTEFMDHPPDSATHSYHYRAVSTYGDY
jgi:hypothetical protein